MLLKFTVCNNLNKQVKLRAEEIGFDPTEVPLAKPLTPTKGIDVAFITQKTQKLTEYSDV